MAKHMAHLALRDSLFVSLRGNHPLSCFFLFGVEDIHLGEVLVGGRTPSLNDAARSQNEW